MDIAVIQGYEKMQLHRPKQDSAIERRRKESLVSSGPERVFAPSVLWFSKESQSTLASEGF